MFCTPHLKIGNLREEPLEEIVKRGRNNIIYWWLHTRGPAGILGKLGVPLQQYHSICHACSKLMLEHAEDLVRYVQANREAVEQDIMDPTHFKAYLRVLENRREELGRMFGWEEGSAGKPGTRA